MRASIGYGKIYNNGDKIDDFQRDGLIKMIVSDEKFMIGIECTIDDLVEYYDGTYPSQSIGKYTIEDLDEMYENLELVFCPVIID
jgi:hypothetical protein